MAMFTERRKKNWTSLGHNVGPRIVGSRTAQSYSGFPDRGVKLIF
jgi:hypothetical protein